jgi:uncharacterized protein (TIGR02646 family)
MRGIRKPWPPANVSPAGQAARSMRQAEQAFRDSLAAAADKVAHARSRFDDLDKAKLRKVLYGEQHHVCVYCERRIDEKCERRVDDNVETPPIEHWRPLSQEPQHALEWENLYLSCPTSETCDDAKKGHRLAWEPAAPSLPWPTQQAYEKWVGFTSGGEMFVRADAPLTPAQRRALEVAIEDRDDDGGHLRRSILNLNHAALVAARKAAIDSEKSRLDREYRGRRASPTDRGAIAARMLRQTEYPAFVSVRVAYLQRALGRGRP